MKLIHFPKKKYKKISEIYKKLENKNLNKNEINELKSSIKEYEELLISKQNEKKITYLGSLSSDVFYHAFKVTFNSIFFEPFWKRFSGL